MIESLSGVIWH